MTELRPRSIVELLHLALAVFVRCWWQLLVALAIVLVPVGIASALLMSAVASATAQARLGARPTFDSHVFGEVLALFIVAFALYPLALGAAFTVAGATLDGGAADLGSALRRAVRRWPTQLAVDVIAFVAAFVIMLALTLVVMVPLVDAVALSSGGAHPAAGFPPFAAPLVIAFDVVYTVLASLGIMIWFSAKFSAALETADPFWAIRSAWVRVFSRSLFRRTFWFVIGIAAVEFAVEMLLAGGISLTGMLGGPVAGSAVVTTPPPARFTVFLLVVSTLFLMERVVLTTVYTRDLQIRLEGFDLARAAETVRELPADADGLNEDDRALIAAFLTRRAVLSPAATRALAATIAARTRPKLQASFAHLGDEELLEHLGRPQS